MASSLALAMLVRSGLGIPACATPLNVKTMPNGKNRALTVEILKEPDITSSIASDFPSHQVMIQAVDSTIHGNNLHQRVLRSLK